MFLLCYNFVPIRNEHKKKEFEAIIVIIKSRPVQVYIKSDNSQN